MRALSLAAVAFFAMLLTSPLHAQQPGGGGGKSIGRVYFGGRDDGSNNSGPRERVLRGRVFDKKGDPVKGVLVYLKETKTSTMKSILTDDEGSYRFVQLAQNLDYELWAQAGAKKSEPKTISSFDNRLEVILNLHFSDPPKAEAAPKPVAAKP